MTEENQGVTEEQVADASQVESQQLSNKEMNFRALEADRDRLAQQTQYLQQRLMEIERSQPNPNSKEIAEDDIPTYGDIKRIRQKDQETINRLEEKLAELEMRTKYEDYNKTVKEYLPDVLKEDPELALAIKDNPMMHKLAYKLAQASPRYHQEKLVQSNSAKVDKIIENSSRPTPANARKNVMVQDEEAKVANMSDEQIWNMFNTAKARY